MTFLRLALGAHLSALRHRAIGDGSDGVSRCGIASADPIMLTPTLEELPECFMCRSGAYASHRPKLIEA